MTKTVAASRTDEFFVSQIPALQLLINLGFIYLSPADAAAARGGKASNVLLEEILREQLKKLNRIQHKGETFHFSEENVQSAIQKLKNVKYDGLAKTNEVIYDLLTLGVALEQALEGSLKSFTLAYIDWRNPRNNVFHVTAEFPVEHTRSYQTYGADIVAFVNGIPFVIMQCRPPGEDIAVAMSHAIENQRDEYIPRLFAYAQLVMAVNRDAARYATIGAPARFWAEWKEEIGDDVLAPYLAVPLPDAVKLSLFDMALEALGTRQEAPPYAAGRAATAQDRALFALCRPERLLDLVWRFTVFDNGTRKMARHQQFFAVHKALETVRTRDAGGRRNGGIVWHTQGSGKSLTMVMLARALLLDPDIAAPRVLLVTDRIDLDKQLGNTFAACGLMPDRAESGKHLIELVSDRKAHIITTLIHKFDRAAQPRGDVDTSTEIFLLVDESHRTNFGSFAARMRQMFPRACYIGFTGTPLMSKEKNNFRLFGGLIHAYSMRDAVADGSVVPLLYEGRHVELAVDQRGIDQWFRRHAQGLTPAQKSELKKKYGRLKSPDEASQLILARAFDISEHFRENWQGLAKAQLVAPSKRAALLYKRYLDAIGYVTSEVVISAPGARESLDVQGDPAHDALSEDDAPPADPARDGEDVHAFWQRAMKRYGNEDEYNRQIVHQFKFAEEPDILIVVDKLLTGFDAPRNTVLYLTRVLRGHTLLQAVARVNRLHDDDTTRRPKDYGYILDYAGVLGELDKALTAYEALAGFDADDLHGTLQSIDAQIARLPRAHAALLDFFGATQGAGQEAQELLLVDAARRETFYERLSAFGQALAQALSSDRFMASVPPPALKIYKNDLRRFQSLKADVKLRYQEPIGDGMRDAAVDKLLHTHISAGAVVKLHRPVSIFDEAAFARMVEEQGRRRSVGAQADLVAHATRRAILDCHRQDPAFYGKLSARIRQAIDDYRSRRISETEYLRRADAVRLSITGHRADDLPEPLHDAPDAAALFGVLKPMLSLHAGAGGTDLAMRAALDIWAIFMATRKVGYWNDIDAQRHTMNAIDDYLYDVAQAEGGLTLSNEDMDEIIRTSMSIARARCPE